MIRSSIIHNFVYELFKSTLYYYVINISFRDHEISIVV
jgi:hypothetical protein